MTYLSGTIDYVSGKVLTILNGNLTYKLTITCKTIMKLHQTLNMRVYAHGNPTDIEYSYTTDVEPIYILQVPAKFIMYIINQSKVNEPRAFFNYLKDIYGDNLANVVSELTWNIINYHKISPFPSSLINSYQTSLFFKKWNILINERRLKMYSLDKICINMNSHVLYKRLFDNPFSLPIHLKYLYRLCKCLHIIPTQADIAMNAVVNQIHKSINRKNTCVSLYMFSNRDLIVKEASNYHLVCSNGYVTFDYMYEMEKHVFDRLAGHKIISGSAGTGKTTLIGKIIKTFEADKISYVVASFTGKAVARIKEVGIKDAYTMHLLMAQKRGGFKNLIIDEASMISTNLMYTFFKCFTHDYKVIFVGDSNQLTPIDHGKLFKHLVRSVGNNHMRLKKVYRTNCQGILELSDYILKYGGNYNHMNDNGNRISGDDNKSCYQNHSYNHREKVLNLIVNSNKNVFMFGPDPSKIVSCIKALVAQGSKPVDITLIVAFNRYRDMFNKLLKSLFLSGKDSVIDDWGNSWSRHEKVMMTTNDYDSMIMNGETGIVSYFKKDAISIKFGTKMIDFSTRDVKSKTKTKNITTAYCQTTHKSEGQEYDNVLIYLGDDDPKTYRNFLTNNLLYTAVTRAKKRLFLFCDRKHFYGMIRNKDADTMELLPSLLNRH